MENLRGNWNYPTSIWFGSGRIADLAAACQSLNISRPLLVTDKGLVELPMVKQAVSSNQAAGIMTTVFSDVKSNPNGDNIEAGVNAYRAGQHDGVIAFGGGSALDAAKAIALMVGQDRPIWDFEDVGDNWTRVNAAAIAPIVAVPTTAGTGSEVGRAALIVNEQLHAKKIIFHPKMLPGLVIADPQLTYALPRHLTAATGMDALSHNLEAYCAPGFHPMADGIALEGIRLILQWLGTACNDGSHEQARSHMLVASSMGATAFQKGLGAMHALAHPLGAIYDSHHGLLNAILMPYVLLRNKTAIEAKMTRLGQYLGLSQPGFDVVLQSILTLRQEIGIPNDLAAIGIDTTRADEIGAMAKQDPSDGGNPVSLSPRDYSDLFVQAVSGQLASVA